MVPGRVTAKKVLKLKSAKTAEGSRVRIRVRGGKVYVNNARVTKVDVKASNGVIHVINRVLIPKDLKPVGSRSKAARTSATRSPASSTPQLKRQPCT